MSNSHKDDDDEDWSVDTSAAAVRERQRDLTSAAASLAVNDDLELPIGRRLEKFFAFVQVIYLTKGNVWENFFF